MFDTMNGGFEERSVGNLVQLLSGFAFKSEQFTTDPACGMPLIRIRDLRTGETACRYGGEFDPTYVIKAGDIVVGMDGEFLAVRWMGAEALLNQRVLKVTSAMPSALDDNYLFYRLQPDLAELEQKISGTTVKHLSTKDIKRLVWDLPPIDEQRRIAEVLRSVDYVVSASHLAVEQAERCLNQQVSAFMQGSLTGPRMMGDITPPLWRVGRCDSFFVLQRGFDITEKQASPGPYRVISSSGPAYWHSESAVSGPVVITGRKGRLGTVFYSDAPCWPHDTTLWVKDFKGHFPRFIYWKLREMNLGVYDAATSVPTLNRNNVHALTISFPPVDEQIEIATYLDAALGVIEAQREHLITLLNTKAIVTADLLSGRVRVPA
jgi:type I restriction enzyme S subunit